MRADPYSTDQQPGCTVTLKLRATGHRVLRGFSEHRYRVLWGFSSHRVRWFYYRRLFAAVRHCSMTWPRRPWPGPVSGAGSEGGLGATGKTSRRPTQQARLERLYATRNFRFSFALPRGPPPHAALTRGPTICLGRGDDACILGVVERAGNALHGARVYVELFGRLAHAHAARQSRPD